MKKKYPPFWQARIAWPAVIQTKMQVAMDTIHQNIVVSTL
jgi:hypothetical protein